MPLASTNEDQSTELLVREKISGLARELSTLNGIGGQLDMTSILKRKTDECDLFIPNRT